MAYAYRHRDQRNKYWTYLLASKETHASTNIKEELEKKKKGLVES